MRIFLTIFFVALSLIAFGQSETNNPITYDTIIPYRGPGAAGQNWVIRITRQANFFTAGSPDTASRPVLLTMQGDGEVSGGNYIFQNHYGPHYYLANGWDGSVVLGNGIHYPLLITVQQNAINTRPNLYGPLIDSLYKEFHWRGGIRYAGLSGGVEVGGWVLGYQATAGNEHYMSMFSCFVNLSGVSPSNPENILGAQPMAYPNLWGYWAHKYGGHYWSTLGNADNQTSTWQIEQMINDSVPGAAYFSWVNIGGSGAHCCWNTMYDPSQPNWQNQTVPFGNVNIVTNGNAANTAGNYVYSATTGTSLFQWMLRQGDTTLVGSNAPALPPLVWTMWLGEYGQPAIHNVGGVGVPYVFSSNLAFSAGTTPGIPQAIVNPHSSLPSFIWCANTIHGAIFCDINGMIWFIGGNEVASDSGYLKPTDTLRKMLVDSRGIPLTGISLATGVYTQGGTPLIIGEGLFIIKHGSFSDSAFYLGREVFGIGGNGTVEDTVRLLPTLMFSLPLPGSTATRILQMTGEAVMVMRLNDGTVWTFGDGTQTPSPFGRPISGLNYASPGQVTIPNVIINGVSQPDSITQIAGGAVPGVIALGKTNKLYGWGHYSGYLGNVANTVYATPTDLTSNITSHLKSSITGAQLGIRQISGNSSVYHIIASDGSLWGWGDNGQGDVGNGIQANLTNPGGSSSPWSLDPTAILILPQTLPVQVTNKHNWLFAYSGFLFTHTFAAIDSTDSLYYCGRNKGGVIPNAMISCNGDGGHTAASYPNSWDMPWFSLISPLGVISTIQQMCPGCPTGQVTVNCFTCGSTVSVTANAGANQSLPAGTTTTQLNGSASSSNGGVIPSWQYIWTQTSGPASTIDVQAAAKPNITFNGGAGTYVYNLFVQDQGLNTNNSSVIVTVGGPAQTGFYFSASGSDVGACTLANPCQTLAKLNTLSLMAGDTIYFARGSTFAGIFRNNSSGAAGNPLIYTVYGTGAEPVIGGMITLSPTGSGPVYTATCSGCTANTNLLTVDGILQSQSTTPNAGSYYTFVPASSTTTSIFDPTDLASMPNIVGNYIAVRSSPFTWDKVKVTAQTTSALTVSPAVSYNNVGGNGWFVLGTTPNANYEWTYSAGTISIYMSSGFTGHTIQVPAADTVIYTTGQHLVFDHLNIQGGNLILAHAAFQTVGDISFTYDSLMYGFDGFVGRSTPLVTFNHCTIAHLGDNGITGQNNTASKYSVLNSKAYDIGMLPGMGGNGPGRYSAINPIFNQPGVYAGQGDSTLIKFDSIGNIGYCGTLTSGNNSHVDSNVIVNFCQILEDGAASYWHDSTAVSYTNTRTATGNYISGGGSAISHLGVSTDFSSAAIGLYADAYSKHITFSGNKVSGVNSNGGFDHAGNTWTGNTFYNSGYSEFLAAEYSGGPTITTLSFTGNALGGVVSGDAAIRLITVNNDLASFGTINNNAYAHVILTSPFYTQTSSGNSFLTLAAWTSDLGYDAASTYVNKTLTFEGNPSQTGTGIFLSGFYGDLFGNRYQSAITLQPRGALLLYLINPLIQLTSPRRVQYN